jgi:hypothetical protein
MRHLLAFNPIAVHMSFDVAKLFAVQMSERSGNLLSNMCAPEAFRDENNMFVRKRSKYRYEPSPRVSNWTENKVWWLHRKKNIIRNSANFLKGTNEKTHPQNFN